MTWLCQPPEHDFDHCKPYEGCGCAGIAFKLAGKATVPTDPSQCTLDNPALGQDYEAMGVVTFDDDQFPGAGFPNGARHSRTSVSAVGIDAINEWKHSSCAA